VFVLGLPLLISCSRAASRSSAARRLS